MNRIDIYWNDCDVCVTGALMTVLIIILIISFYSQKNNSPFFSKIPVIKVLGVFLLQ